MGEAGYTDEAIGPGEARMIAMNERLVVERNAARARVAELEAALGRIALCCQRCVPGTPWEPLEGRHRPWCSALVASLALAGGAQTETPAEGEEG